MISFFALFLFHNCCDVKDDYEPHIYAFAFYETAAQPGIKIPDKGAKVYYYYRRCTDDFAGYTYQKNGEYVKENSPSIVPDEIHVVGESGKFFFIPRYMDKEATMVI